MRPIFRLKITTMILSRAFTTRLQPTGGMYELPFQPGHFHMWKNNEAVPIDPNFQNKCRPLNWGDSSAQGAISILHGDRDQ